MSPSQTDYVTHGMSVLEGALMQASCNIATFGIITVELCRTITSTTRMNNLTGCTGLSTRAAQQTTHCSIGSLL